MRSAAKFETASAAALLIGKMAFAFMSTSAWAPTEMNVELFPLHNNVRCLIRFSVSSAGTNLMTVWLTTVIELLAKETDDDVDELDPWSTNLAGSTEVALMVSVNVNKILPLLLRATSKALSCGAVVSSSNVLTGKAGILHGQMPKHGAGHEMSATIGLVGFFCMSSASAFVARAYVVAFDTARDGLAFKLLMSAFVTSTVMTGPSTEAVLLSLENVNVSSAAAPGRG